MAYGRVYIDNLRKKVTALFDELRAENHLCESAFIEAFKRQYPKDYAMLLYEWEFKVHEFKKNRKGNPKPHPIRPEKILSNMYRNYYYKLVKNPAIHRNKLEQLDKIRKIAGQYGYKIKIDNSGKYNVINKATKEIERERIDFVDVKHMFSSRGLQTIKKRLKREKEEQSNEY